MPTIRIRVTNSLDATTVAGTGNATITKAPNSEEFYILSTSGGGSFADLGVVPLALLRSAGIIGYQDYIVNAFIDTSGAAGVTLFAAGAAAIEGVGGAVYPIGRARTVDPSGTMEGKVQQIHLASPDYGVQLLSTGAVGVQVVVLEFMPVERVGKLEVSATEIDGPDLGASAVNTNNVQVESALDILSATAATVRYPHTGPTASIEHIAAVIQSGTIAGGNATITWSIVGVGAITGGVNTLTVGQTVNGTSLATPTAANVITQGQILLGTVGGANVGAGTAAVSIDLLPV